MTHGEFCRTHASSTGEWGVRGFLYPVLLGLGPSGALVPVGVYLSVLAVVLGGVSLAFRSDASWSALWALPFAFAFTCAPTSCDLAGAKAFAFQGVTVGLIAFIASGNPHHLPCGTASLFAYFGGGLVRGVTMHELGRVLAESPAAFERLERRGLLFLGRYP